MIIYRELNNPDALHCEWELNKSEMTTKELIAVDQAMMNLNEQVGRIINSRLAKSPERVAIPLPAPVDADSKLSEGEAKAIAFKPDRPIDPTGYA
jgi:hypothetical protein